MQPEKKLDFINSCRPVKNGPNCWLDGFIHIHDCFHHCVEQTHKNGRNFDFDPADHCPGFLDIDKRELCILGSQK
uniref:Uncharacterized protein n=1 Tax=Acrobeloides nanus TaxID=290746 RepID=A0A914EAT1_9BILA